MAALATGQSSHAVEALLTVLVAGQPESRWLEVSADPVVVDGGRHVILTLTDITRRKLTEEQLRELTQRLTYHVDHSPLAVIECGPDMRLTRWAGAAEQIFGWPAAEVLGKRMGDFRWIYEDDQPQVTAVTDELVGGTNLRRFSANRNYRKDGALISCEWYNSSLRDAAGNLRSILSLVLDVTERYRAEEQVKASLAEKEVLLKEIHHRVKNNLQVIASLISLQTDNVPDAGTRAVFDALRYRVRTMALVHEKIYQTGDLARLDFADYAGSLLQHLWQAHEISNKVRLKLEIAPVALPVKAAVNCGLILNELASNALKHGFPGGRAGEVTVSLEHEAATNMLHLRVRDNGVGLPAGLDWRQSPSLGLQLVQMLTTGTVETGPGPGTEFRVNFPLTNVQP